MPFDQHDLSAGPAGTAVGADHPHVVPLDRPRGVVGVGEGWCFDGSGPAGPPGGWQVKPQREMFSREDGNRYMMVLDPFLRLPIHGDLGNRPQFKIDRIRGVVVVRPERDCACWYWFGVEISGPKRPDNLRIRAIDPPSTPGECVAIPDPLVFKMGARQRYFLVHLISEAYVAKHDPLHVRLELENDLGQKCVIDETVGKHVPDPSRGDNP